MVRATKGDSGTKLLVCISGEGALLRECKTNFASFCAVFYFSQKEGDREGSKPFLKTITYYLGSSDDPTEKYFLREFFVVQFFE